MQALEKRNNQLGGIFAPGRENQEADAADQADQNLQRKLFQAAEAKILLLGDFGVVVHKSNGRESQ